MKTHGGAEVYDLYKVAESKVNEPMNTWPDHIEFHRRNLHPFAGSLAGNMYFDETCLRCQLERAAEAAIKQNQTFESAGGKKEFRNKEIAER